MSNQRRLARPDRIRLRLRDDDVGAIPLELPARRTWPFGLVFGVMFAIFAGIAWTTAAGIVGHPVQNVFDLTVVLFQGFWVLGWSVGVVILGALTLFLLFYSESARLHEGRLVHVPRLGPLKVLVEYDLARVRNVRLEDGDGEGRTRLRFDYDGGRVGLGDLIPRAEAQALVRTIAAAADLAGAPSVPTSASRSRRRTRSRDEPITSTPPAREVAPPALTSPSGLALVAANVVPLVGVLFFEWDLASVVVLFWAESGVIAFYTALKIGVVNRLAAVVAVPFFIGHFGGFMAIHFLFIYSFFVRGINAGGTEPGVWGALAGVFGPVWIPLAMLFISHGLSFFQHFIGEREYDGATVEALMTAPYGRIIAMQFVLLFGGWVILLLGSPIPALALLVLLKTGLDFRAHQREHVDARARRQPGQLARAGELA